MNKLKTVKAVTNNTENQNAENSNITDKDCNCQEIQELISAQDKTQGSMEALADLNSQIVSMFQEKSKLNDSIQYELEKLIVDNHSGSDGPLDSDGPDEQDSK